MRNATHLGEGAAVTSAGYGSLNPLGYRAWLVGQQLEEVTRALGALEHDSRSRHEGRFIGRGGATAYDGWTSDGELRRAIDHAIGMVHDRASFEARVPRRCWHECCGAPAR